MLRISFLKDINALPTKTARLLVVVPEVLLRKKRWPKGLSPKIHALLSDLATDAPKGSRGTLVSTLTGTTPRRLLLGVIPKPGSRYNCPARPEAVSRIVQNARLNEDEHTALVVVVESASALTPIMVAIARAFPSFHRKSSKSKKRTVHVGFVDAQGRFIKTTPEQRDPLEVVRTVSALVDAPPTEMNPQALAKEAESCLKGMRNVRFSRWVGDALLRAGLSGIHSVGRTALSAPRMLLAQYSPPRPKGPHVALIGKGVTFDTGGLHLKGRGAIETMKMDMGGAAAVLGAFRLLAKRRPKHKLSLILCLAENAIGPKAYKPDDIVTMHSQKTVEINNTDAEGRLLLADGLSYAARKLKADYLFDAATLTGAQLIATGTMHGVIVSNDAELEQRVVEAGRTTGDLVHPLPFAPEFYKAEFKSNLADMKNSVKNRANAQSACAAQFLYNHIEDTPSRWCHLDLAGPAFRSGRGTGFGAVLLAEVVHDLAT